jgi:hypothetical protein
VKRLLAVLLIGLVGCGGIVIQSNVGTGGVTSFSGLVSIVQLSSVAHNGTFISVTVVTLLQSGTATNLTFCGNMASQFPVNTSVSVNFISAVPCSTAQLVIII